jgi:hypothetical protein
MNAESPALMKSRFLLAGLPGLALGAWGYGAGGVRICFGVRRARWLAITQ